MPSPDQFRLKRLEEAFDGGIVVTVALPAHRWLESVVAQKLLIIMCAVLRPTIGVMNAAWWWSADRNRHVQRPECQILFYAVTDGPADHTPRKQIKITARQTPIAGKTIPRIVFWPGSYLPGPDIGYVTCPFLVWPTSGSARSR